MCTKFRVGRRRARVFQSLYPSPHDASFINFMDVLDDLKSGSKASLAAERRDPPPGSETIHPRITERR